MTSLRSPTAMSVIATARSAPVGDEAPVEVVERKGLGHPDTICDALAEEFSIALSEFYVERFGAILHHNVDKALLSGGQSRPAFGGGEVLAPILVYLAGRAVHEHRGCVVPVEEIARRSARAWFDKTLRCLDFDRHVELHCLVHPGSVDLVELFERKQHVGVPLANDTSCGVGHAPLTTLERIVLAAEHRLNAPLVKDRVPSAGEDVKVMGVRHGADIGLTVACAQIDRHTTDVDDYRAHIAALEGEVREAVATVTDREVGIDINAGDDFERGDVYLTVTGTSAEAGDDGAAGRGNRVGGLITPYRAMTMESAAGKNPISHVGKLYNALALRIAQAVVRELDDVRSADCFLVSEIGRPITDPALVEVVLGGVPDEEARRLQPRLAEIARHHLRSSDELWHPLLERAIPIY